MADLEHEPDDLEDDLEEEVVESTEGEEAPEAPDAEVEEEARKYGWRPKEGFAKSPDRWVDAARYMEMPSTQIKALRYQRREMERELRVRDERLASIEGATRTAMQRLRDQERQRYEGEVQAIRRSQREAAEAGDLERFDQLQRREESVRTPASEPQMHPEIAAYAERNAWVKDPEMVSFAANAIETNPEVKGLPALRQVQWAEKRVREYYPDRFADKTPPPQESRPQRQRVDGGGLASSSRPSSGLSKIPAEDRRIGEEHVKMGLFKDLDEWAKEYHGE